MKKLSILLAALAGLMSGCDKTRTCVDPAPGDTPLTVIPGVELGSRWLTVQTSPSLDTLYDGLTDDGLGGYIAAVGAMYANLPARFFLSFSPDTLLSFAQASLLLDESDTANAVSVRDYVLGVNTLKYGAPQRRLWEAYGDAYEQYFYCWEVCDGVQITLVGRTDYRGPQGWHRVPEPGDTALRSLVVEFKR